MKTKLQEAVEKGEVTQVLYLQVGNVGVYWPIKEPPKVTWRGQAFADEG